MNYGVGQVSTLPIAPQIFVDGSIIPTVQKCIELSKTDWDSYETSWDFKRHPLV